MPEGRRLDLLIKRKDKEDHIVTYARNQMDGYIRIAPEVFMRVVSNRKAQRSIIEE